MRMVTSDLSERVSGSCCGGRCAVWIVFFFNDTATTEIYTLSLHDALPIFAMNALIGILGDQRVNQLAKISAKNPISRYMILPLDRKSTRLNSSHANISYAVFCLKKKK